MSIAGPPTRPRVRGPVTAAAMIGRPSHPAQGRYRRELAGASAGDRG
jgi:hypothetical protein